jgi:hypothetical protein
LHLLYNKNAGPYERRRCFGDTLLHWCEASSVQQKGIPDPFTDVKYIPGVELNFNQKVPEILVAAPD